MQHFDSIMATMFPLNTMRKLVHAVYIPSRNCHLTMVEGFGCPNNSRSYVVRGCFPLVGSHKANWSKVRGQTKHRSQDFNDAEYKDLYNPEGYWDLTLDPQVWGRGP